MEILNCGCGDKPRLRTNGGSYVEFFCASCGYMTGSYLNNYIEDAIKNWNESDRDAKKQKAGAKAFDDMMNFCQKEIDEGRGDETGPIKKFFQKFKSS